MQGADSSARRPSHGSSYSYERANSRRDRRLVRRDSSRRGIDGEDVAPPLRDVRRSPERPTRNVTFCVDGVAEYLESDRQHEPRFAAVHRRGRQGPKRGELWTRWRGADARWTPGGSACSTASSARRRRPCPRLFRRPCPGLPTPAEPSTAYRYSDDRAADRPSVDRADRLACADEPLVSGKPYCLLRFRRRDDA